MPWTYVLEDVNGEEIIGTLHEKRIVKDKSKRV